MTGFIGVGQLRYSMPPNTSENILTIPVLTNLGEKMSDEEVDELLKAVDTSSGEINYTGMFLKFHIVELLIYVDLVRTILAN
jgi:Ca2+-binding EF-hand superfamily protein